MIIYIASTFITDSLQTGLTAVKLLQPSCANMKLFFFFLSRCRIPCCLVMIIFRNGLECMVEIVKLRARGEGSSMVLYIIRDIVYSCAHILAFCVLVCIYPQEASILDILWDSLKD